MFLSELYQLLWHQHCGTDFHLIHSWWTISFPSISTMVEECYTFPIWEIEGMPKAATYARATCHQISGQTALTVSVECDMRKYNHIRWMSESGLS